jgi:hypothetical protein
VHLMRIGAIHEVGVLAPKGQTSCLLGNSRDNDRLVSALMQHSYIQVKHLTYNS